MRIGLLVVAALALTACGGRLSDDETTTSTNGRHDGGPSSAPSSAPSSPPRNPDGGGDSTPALDIGALPGLALWIQADKGIELDPSHTDVTSWADLSPEHNDLTLHEGNGARANSTLDSRGGRPAVKFDGVSSYMVSPSAKLANWGGDFYVAAAVHSDATIDYNSGLFSCYGAPPPVPGHTMTQLYVSGAHHARADIESDGYSDNAESSALADEPVIIAFRRSGTTLEARRNGIVDKTETFPRTTTPKCTKAFLGALPADGTSATTALFTGALSELVVVQGSVTSHVADTIEAQLMAKYLLPR